MSLMVKEDFPWVKENNVLNDLVFFRVISQDRVLDVFL
jgi:hypothetical protein